MNPEDKKWWLHQEEARLINYQHQHRGVSFIKLLLPPAKVREVNIVGLDNHIYRGRIPRVPEDQLPPEVDPASIDEEALYKEIRDMNFPPVPPQELLGPSRRIGGPYTLEKKLILAPVKVDCKDIEETLLLGRDGSIYKGTAKYASAVELEKQLRGTKRFVRKVRQQSSSRGFVEPSAVFLQTNDKLSKEISIRGRQAHLIEVPIANVGMILDVIKSQNIEKITKSKQKRQERKDVEAIEQVKDTNETESKDEQGIESTEDSKVTENTDVTQEAEDAEGEYVEDLENRKSTEALEEAINIEGSKDTEDQYAEDSEKTESTEAMQEALNTGGSTNNLNVEDMEETFSKDL